MPGYQGYGYYPDPEEERRLREMDLTQDPEALAGSAGVRPPPTMDLTQDPVALQGSPDWQRMNQSRVDMRDELDNPPPSMDLTRDPAALNSPMLQRQMAQRAPQPPAAGLPMQGSLSSLLPQRDSQMDSRWRTAENNALDSSGYMGDQKYGLGEAVRDFAPMAIGGGLDILLNKGRGLGALAGAGMQANALQQKNRDAEADAAGKFALNSRDQREQMGNPELDAAYKQAQMQNWVAQQEAARGNLGLHTTQTDLRKTKQAYDLDPNNPEAAQRAGIVQQQSGVDVSGMSNKGQGALSGLLSGAQRLQNAGPIANAQNASDVAYAAPKAAQAQIGGEQGKNLAAGTTLDTRKQLGEVPEVDKNTQAFATAFAKDSDSAIKLMSAANGVWSSQRTDEGELPGFSRKETAAAMLPGGGNLLTADAKKNQQLKAAVEEFFSRDQSGAAISKSEQGKFLYELFGDPTTSAFDKEQALDNFMETIVKPSMRARASGNPKAANMVLSAAGLSLGDPQRGAAPPAAAKQYPNAQTREIPTPPSTRKAVQRPDGMFDVPNGKRPYSAQDVEVFRRAGLLQ